MARLAVHSAPSGLALSGTRCIIASHRTCRPLLSFDTNVSAEALTAQLEAGLRVRTWRAAERERQEEAARELKSRSRASSSRSSVPATHTAQRQKKVATTHKTSSSCGLTRAEIRALQSRELGPEDYELLLRLDESVSKRDVLSETEAAALIESALEGDAECSVCLSDLASGDSAVLLSCGHYFHPPCIKAWLVKGKDTCPNCCAKATQCVDV